MKQNDLAQQLLMAALRKYEPKFKEPNYANQPTRFTKDTREVEAKAKSFS